MSITDYVDSTFVKSILTFTKQELNNLFKYVADGCHGVV